MRIHLDSLGGAVKAGVAAKRETDAPVRVAVYVDDSASRAIVECVRDAFVPRTTSALVRVERLSASPAVPRTDTDVVLVLSCGSELLEGAVHELVVAGAPVVVIAESSVEVPFIQSDTPLLGLIADVAFASNFPFMRIAAANRAITSAAIANMATGALAFVPGADFPVMALTEVGMVLKMSSMFGYKLEPERGYEIAAVLAAGLALRGIARVACRSAGRASFIVKAAIAAAGTYGMGRVLASAYERGIDYGPVNERLGELGRRARAIFGGDGSQQSDVVEVR